jgi:putative toxin-antitoxin system antitoxin component (TIGR02293 family)
MAIKDRTPVRRAASKDIARLRERLQQGQLAPHAYMTLLGLRSLDTVGLVDRIQAGLSYAALERFQRNISLSNAELGRLLQIPLRTLSRRKEEGRLQPDESDRLVRSARLFVRTLELFEGNAEEARTWLGSSNRALGGVVPLELAPTEVGAREIEDLIDRLEHGVVS